MSAPDHIAELKKYGKGDLTQADLAAISAEVYQCPDRGMVLILASIVEKSLEKLLKRVMREQGVDELFKPAGMLGDFGRRIQLSYALRLIGPISRRELDIIRNLKNQFAHSREPIYFTTNVVSRCCQQFMLPDMDGIFDYFPYLNNVPATALAEASDITSPRTRFYISCVEILQRIYFIHEDDVSLPENQLP